MITLVLAIGILCQADEKEVLDQFWKDYKSTLSESTRAGVVRALAKSKGDKITTTLIGLLASGSGPVKKAAAEGLATRREERAMSGLAAAAAGNKDNPEVRAAAIASLGAIGMEAAMKTLIDLLDDYKNGVAAAAVDAIAKIGSPDAIDALLKVLEKSEREAKAGGRVNAGGYTTGSRNDNLVQLKAPIVKALKAITREKFGTHDEWETWWGRSKGTLKLEAVYWCPVSEKTWTQSCPSGHKNDLYLAKRIKE